ncbi:hypothetical protein M9Y10_033934 [Tritrichomonas musculus]|uniref:Uncharacterized protein n=1 Tax=Tritrichomonas musculus TaxID=1915356 RepID=A0ABR2KDP1_9EUKA
MKKGRPTNHYLHYNYIIWIENDGSFSCYDINKKNKITENDNLFKGEIIKKTMKKQFEISNTVYIPYAFNVATNENHNDDLLINQFNQNSKQTLDCDYINFDLKSDYIDISFDRQWDYDSFAGNKNYCLINDEKNPPTSFFE